MIEKLILFVIVVMYIIGLSAVIFCEGNMGLAILLGAAIISYIALIMSFNKSAKIIRFIRSDLQNMSDYLTRK